MTQDPTGGDPKRDDEAVSEEFARMLSDEGYPLRPGSAPREPAALPPATPSPSSAASPTPEELEERRARARAAHPSFRTPTEPTSGSRRSTGLTDDEVLLGDFVPPQPELSPPSTGSLYSWGALIAGLVLMLLAAMTDLIPPWCAVIGAGLAVGGLIALLLRVPRSRSDDSGNGAQV